ncbi:uncharacterized protein LOC116666854 [Camelus ferus]|uniref:Uncharacterized protein LOC116666854 n=1 Tax=Camelus ferus TaxID=419612 RepID=A0A8B8TWX2_CAMFR|nr:uncharacterized protein LOC116666854 [Camelus ferus]
MAYESSKPYCEVNGSTNNTGEVRASETQGGAVTCPESPASTKGSAGFPGDSSRLSPLSFSSLPSPADLTPASSQRRASDPSPASPRAVAHLRACKQPQEQRPGGLQQGGGEEEPRTGPPPPPWDAAKATTSRKTFLPLRPPSKARLGPGCCCAPGSGVSALSHVPGDSNRSFCLPSSAHQVMAGRSSCLSYSLTSQGKVAGFQFWAFPEKNSTLVRSPRPKEVFAPGKTVHHPRATDLLGKGMPELLVLGPHFE